MSSNPTHGVAFWWDDDDNVRFALDQHAQLDLYSARSLKQQTTGRQVAPLLTHYYESEPTSLCSYSLKMCA